MILIVGGAYQGKTAYAEAHFGDKYKIVNQYHLRVREQLQAGLEPLSEAERFLEKEASAEGDIDRLILISDEVGYGLVPIDELERAYREKAGRVNCYLAEKAEQVIRVVCGLGSRIK